MTIFFCVIAALLAAAAWFAHHAWFMNNVDAAFSAGHKLGRASAYMSKTQIDNMLMNAGIDPTRLPPR